MSDDPEKHYLAPFLQEKLPELGLDFDTYGSYVIGVVDSADQEEDEADGIWELLQASSETHSENEDVWTNLREEVASRKEEYLRTENEAKEKELALQSQTKQAQLAKDIQLAEEMAKKQEEAAEAAPEEVDASKEALLSRFAYDDSEVYDKDGNLVDPAAAAGKSKGGKSKGSTAAASAGEGKGADNHKAQQSKADARAQTKQANAKKAAAKEQRRQRATKGERRR